MYLLCLRCLFWYILDDPFGSYSHFMFMQEKLELEAALQVRAGAFHAADSATVQELQQKLLSLQEELTEMHR